MFSSAWFHRHVSLLCLAMALALFVLPAQGPVAAQSAPPASDTQNRSLIIGTEAGKIPNPKADRNASLAGLLNRGRQAALDKARGRLQELDKFGLDFELVRANPGSIPLLRQQEIPSDAGDPPRLWMETEIPFVLKEKKTGGRPDPMLLDRADLLDVRIWTDRKEYEEGQTITLYLQGNRDFYGKVVRMDGKGPVLQILPNNYRQISSFERDKRYRIPDAGDRYRLTVRPPFGAIRFIVYAARLPMSQVNLQPTMDGIFKYRASPKAFGRSVRHLIPAGEERLTEFCEASWTIRTVPRR